MNVFARSVCPNYWSTASLKNNQQQNPKKKQPEWTPEENTRGQKEHAIY